MKKSDVPSAAELFNGMPPLESVKALFSVSHSQEEAKGKRTLAMYEISCVHFHGVPVRRVFVELPDEEKERLARENGPDLEYVGLCGTVDASARWQAHCAQIMKEHVSSMASAILHCLCRSNEMFDRSFTVATSWWRCPPMKRNGSKASDSRSTMESAQRSSIRMATLRRKLGS